VSRTQALKMLGNAVVPQQAALAIELLTRSNKSTYRSQELCII